MVMDTALQAMNAVQNTIEELQAENNKLQDCIEDHIKELAAERKFRDELEAWLEDTIRQEKSNEWNMKLGYDAIIVEALEDVQHRWNELKAQHLATGE